MLDIQRCKKCGRPYSFYPTENGRLMPVDIEPNPRGNVIIVDGVAVVLKKDDPRLATTPTSSLRSSHFQTCKYAQDYRKRHPR